MQALERRVEYLEQQVAMLKSEKIADADFILGVEVVGNLYKSTKNSGCIEKALLVNEMFSLNVSSNMPVENLYTKLKQSVKKVIIDKFVTPAKAEIDQKTRQKNLENERNPIKFQTAQKDFTMEIFKVQIIPHNIILPRCASSLSERGLGPTKSLKVTVGCRLSIDWFIKREKSQDQKYAQFLSLSSERTLTRSAKRRSRFFSKLST